MISIVYSTAEDISRSLGERVVRALDAKEKGTLDGGRRRFLGAGIEIIQTPNYLTGEEELERLLKTDLIIFLSCHKAKWAAFTVHSLGNWSDSAIAGGKPFELGMAAPLQMASVLREIKKVNNTNIKLTYEATHHGPLLNVPSFFAEVGGSEEIGDLHYDLLAMAISRYIIEKPEPQGKIAIGIGGTHYPEKFTKLGLEGKYSFSHLLPKYYSDNVEMLGKAMERSLPKAEYALLDWKGVGTSAQRGLIIKKLGELGIDFVRV